MNLLKKYFMTFLHRSEGKQSSIHLAFTKTRNISKSLLGDPRIAYALHLLFDKMTSHY